MRRIRRWTKIIAAFALTTLVAAGCTERLPLSEVLQQEQGLDFGSCRLNPPPLPGAADVHIVLSEKDGAAASWETRTAQLLDVVEGRVLARRELALPEGLNQREVVDLTCKDHEIVAVTSTGGSQSTTHVYLWNGRELSLRPH